MKNVANFVKALLLVKCKLVYLERFSGTKASVYSLMEQLDGEAVSVIIDRFIYDFKAKFAEEVVDIARRLKSMGFVLDAQPIFLNRTKGCTPMTWYAPCMICPASICGSIAYALQTDWLLLEAGGPKTTRAWQEDVVLSRQVHTMMQVSAIIRAKLKNGSLRISATGLKLDGDLYISRI